MEYQFRLDPFTGRHQIRMEYGFEALGRFIEDELGRDGTKLKALISQLQGGSCHFEGREWGLHSEEGELLVQHHSLGLDAGEWDPDLDLDDSSLEARCGLEDGLKLLAAWLDFVAPA
ncbi:YacL family protein [Gallaecimonas kandeliae]|uniref:YacL family protein n=1 Tax=Gallaecimonas kandeliae TaxID=3029055 RepID=UPI002648437C|nr:YacL family protein [Gallaecimonas kandeliae]WKE66122.1 YacL family protein [Gallaecimonas kandeliae]